MPAGDRRHGRKNVRDVRRAHLPVLRLLGFVFVRRRVSLAPAGRLQLLRRRLPNSARLAAHSFKRAGNRRVGGACGPGRRRGRAGSRPRGLSAVVVFRRSVCLIMSLKISKIKFFKINGDPVIAPKSFSADAAKRWYEKKHGEVFDVRVMSLTDRSSAEKRAPTWAELIEAADFDPEKLPTLL